MIPANMIPVNAIFDSDLHAYDPAVKYVTPLSLDETSGHYGKPATWQHKIRLLFRKDRESYLCFYRILGFYPHNIQIYEQALLHKSSAVRSEKGRPLNNERLEFLGDAILDAIVGDIVYKRFEGKREGFLTNTRSKIVQRETLNKLAVEIGLDKLIKYSTRSSSHNSYMYGNAFEAFIGAIYLDQGYERCKQFMEQRIINRYIDLDKISRKEVNFKSKLIEWSQKNKMEVSFELIEQFLDHDSNPVFQTEVRRTFPCSTVAKL